MTLSSLVAHHLEQFARTPTKSGELPRPATLAAHRLHLERFAYHLDSSSPPPTGESAGDLTLNVCKNWILSIAESSSRSNTNQALSALDGFLHWLADENLFPSDQLARWSDFHSSQYRPPLRANYQKYLSPDKLAAMMLALEAQPNWQQRPRDVAFFGLLFFGPSRLGELQRLDMDHVKHFPGDEPFFEITIPSGIAKNHRESRLCLFETCVVGTVDIYRHLRDYAAWRATVSPTGPFFLTVRGSQYRRPTVRNWHKVFATSAKRAALPEITSHWLRHTYGEMVRGHLDSRDMQQIYGHTSDKTTENYTHHDNLDRLRAARRNAVKAITSAA